MDFDGFLERIWVGSLIVFIKIVYIACGLTLRDGAILWSHVLSHDECAVVQDWTSPNSRVPDNWLQREIVTHIQQQARSTSKSQVQEAMTSVNLFI